MHPRRAGLSTRGRRARFFSELGPAGVEGVVFVLCGIEFEQGFLEGGGIGCDLRVFDAGTGMGEAIIGVLNKVLDGGELAGFEIGELLFSTLGGSGLSAGLLR